MIKASPQSKWHTPCTFDAQTLRMAFALTFIAGVTHAGGQNSAWAEFETRCLAPTEAVKPTVTDTLTKTSGDDVGYEIWRPDGAAWELQRDRVTCAVSGFAWSDAVQAQAETWIGAAVEAGRYEVLPSLTIGSPLTLRSTNWREPKIEVIVKLQQGFQPFMQVRETELEG